MIKTYPKTPDTPEGAFRVEITLNDQTSPPHLPAAQAVAGGSPSLVAAYSRRQAYMRSRGDMGQFDEMDEGFLLAGDFYGVGVPCWYRGA